MGRFCECCRGWDRFRIHLLTLMIIVAFAASILTVTTCRFWQISTGSYQQAGGIFKYNYRFDECRSYIHSNIEFDPSTEAARAFSVLAIIFSGMALIMILSLQCIMHSNKAWRVLSVFLLFSCFSQCMTFLIFKQVKDTKWENNEGMEYSIGLSGITSCVAVGIYLFTGLFVLFTATPESTVYQCRLIGTFLNVIAKKMDITPKKKFGQDLRNTKPIQLVVLIMIALSFLFSLITILDCKYIRLEFEGASTIHLGLFLYHYPPTDSCRKYEISDEHRVGAAGASARVFAIMAVLFGGALLILLWSRLVLNFPLLINKVTFVIAFLCGIVQCLTLLAYKQALNESCASERANCHAGQDTILVIVASFLYFCIAAAIECFGGIVQNEQDSSDSKNKIDAGDSESGLDKPCDDTHDNQEEEHPHVIEDRKGL